MEPLKLPARFAKDDPGVYFGCPKAKKAVNKYASGSQPAFINGVNLYLNGPTNSGKTYLACYLLRKLASQGFNVGYTTLSELTTFMLQPTDGVSFSRILRETDFLVIDSADEGVNEGSRLALSRAITFRRDEAMPTILCSVHEDDGSEDAYFTAALGDTFARFLDLAINVPCSADPFKVAAYLKSLKSLK